MWIFLAVRVVKMLVSLVIARMRRIVEIGASIVVDIWMRRAGISW